MQPFWVTLHPTLNYSKRLPTQTPVTQWVWTEILFPVSRLGSEAAGVWPGGCKAAGPCQAVGSRLTYRGEVSCAFSRLSSRVQLGPPSVCWAEATSRGRAAPGLAPGCRLLRWCSPGTGSAPTGTAQPCGRASCPFIHPHPLVDCYVLKNLQ